MRGLRTGVTRQMRIGALRVVGFVTAVVLGAATLAMTSMSPASAASEGNIYATGLNEFGNLGNGTTTDSRLPVPTSLPPGVTVTAVSTGFGHTLALTNTGTILSWGLNAYGQLGNGSNIDSTIPVPVSLPAGVTITAVSAGWSYSMALTSTGKVLTWGRNQLGQLGNGTTTDSLTPVSVSLPAGITVKEISAGGQTGHAVTSGGALLGWGNNGEGELGDGTFNTVSSPVYAAPPAGAIITSVAGGGHHTLALTSAGDVLAWGWNNHGQLGNHLTATSNAPVRTSVPTGLTVTSIAAGFGHSAALTSTGQVLAWGTNVNGELGDGTLSVFNSAPQFVAFLPGHPITAIASTANSFHTMAYWNQGGTLYAWGYNQFGQLGNGAVSSPVPIPVRMPPGLTVTGFSAGFGTSMIITEPR